MLFFAVETLFGASGVWYMIGLGATALVFSLLLPRGIWGTIEQRFDIRLLPVGYFLRDDTKSSSEPAHPAGTPQQSTGP